MAKANSIPAFPADEDRTEFGAWLSGFCDGESCFQLNWRVRDKSNPRDNPVASFTINLRSDDSAILSLIRSFWQCGTLHAKSRCVFYGRNGREQEGSPQTVYHVRAIPHLVGILVPHFDRFRLRAKKANDFRIWREGVVLLGSRERRGYGSNGWTPTELAHFTALYDALKTQRVYNAPPTEPPTPPEDDCPLFGKTITE